MSPSLAKDLVNNPSLLALLKSIPTTSGGGKGKEKEIKSEGGSGREGTPTPTAPKKGESIPGGCFNCGTMETTMWRVKTYADGTKKKVCDGTSGEAGTSRFPSFIPSHHDSLPCSSPTIIEECETGD